MLFKGLDGGVTTAAKQTTQTNIVPSEQPVYHLHSPEAQQNQIHWGENRLADVVKGTVKAKGKDTGSNPTSPRATSPQQICQGSQMIHRQSSIPGAPEFKDVASGNGEIQFNAITLTPPSSPDK